VIPNEEDADRNVCFANEGNLEIQKCFEVIDKTGFETEFYSECQGKKECSLEPGQHFDNSRTDLESCIDEGANIFA
jgi:hypothetical protein